jgi:hypothetical protein
MLYKFNFLWKNAVQMHSLAKPCKTGRYAAVLHNDMSPARDGKILFKSQALEGEEKFSLGQKQLLLIPIHRCGLYQKSRSAVALVYPWKMTATPPITKIIYFMLFNNEQIETRASFIIFKRRFYATQSIEWTMIPL